jgi:hypothetical protein
MFKFSTAILSLGALISVCMTSTVWAASKTTTQIASVAATATTPTNGQCTVGYSDQCTNLGSCTCVSITNGVVKGSLIGKGTGTANLQVTSDDGAKTNGAVNEPGCGPNFVDATLTNGSFHVDLALLVVQCPTKTSGVKSFTGGFSVESASNNETGSGTATGTFNKTTGAVSIKLVGTITTP